MDDHDVRVIELRHRLRFLTEASCDLSVVDQVRVQDLERDAAAEDLVARGVDRAVASLTDPGVDEVLADSGPALHRAGASRRRRG